MTIDFAEGLKLPIEVASSPIALLAQRGRGKTRAAKKLAEAFHAAGVPPVILDPAGVWWGLRLAADGKHRGLDIPVLGGLHGDKPLLATGGEILAEALVRTRRPCVIDTTGFGTEAEKKRFATAFCETFYRQKMKHRTPVHLFLEEADEWIPERPGPDEARMLGAIQRIVRLGRNFGIGITMISQRPQGLSKTCLNLSEVVIALGMAGAHEKKAMKGWMDEKDVPAEKRADVLATLPRLGWNKFTKTDGGALVWAPLLDLFEVVKVKEPATLDSSATPEVGDDAETGALPHLDLDDLAKAMAATVEEAKANDPRELRAEIARLRAELAKKPAAIAAPAAEVHVVEVVSIPPEIMDDVLEAASSCEGLSGAINEVTRTLAQMESRAQRIALDIREAVRRIDSLKGGVHRGHVAKGDRAATVHSPARAALKSTVAARPTPPPPDGEKIGEGAMRLLKALASRHPTPLSKKQLATLGEMKVTGGAFRTYVSWLRVRGYLSGSDPIQIEESGLAAAGPVEAPRSHEELVDSWRAKLNAGAAKMLDVLVDVYPEAISREDLAARCEMELSGGAFRTYLSKLRVNGLADNAGDGVRASDNLFPEPS